VLLAAGSTYAQRAGEEITYPSKSFSKLDTFEGLNLEDADKLYGKQDYTGAYAAYKAFSFEFPKSAALPYVLLRMGRCLHNLDKRHAAITAYQDVVDYFPDDVRYAAGALYYIGVCHQQNGDIDKQTAVWARMVKDDDYVAQPNSGSALVHLAAAMDKLEKFDEAAEYRWRTAVNFAQSNPQAAKDARSAVIHHYAVRSPNHDKLKEFFTVTSAFGHYQGKGDNPEGDYRYWQEVMNRVLGAGENKENACRYWAGKFGDKFGDNDELRRKLFAMQRAYENDSDAWAARMSKQFTKQPATIARVVDWVGHFDTPESQLEFASKHGGPLMASAGVNELTRVIEGMRWNRDKFYEKFVATRVSGLKSEEKVALMNRLRWPCGMHNEAQSVLRQVNLSGMSDKQIRDIGMFAGEYLPEEDVLRYFAKMKDSLESTKARFDYYMGKSHRNRPFQEKALAEIPALRQSPNYAGQGLSWTEASLLRELGRHEEAIKAYRAANKQPDSTWAITDCLVAMKQYDAAIKNVAGLESVKSTAPAACLRIADIYRVAGDKGKEVEQLRLVLRRYPKSGESSQAHQRLESYGVKLLGGEEKAEE